MKKKNLWLIILAVIMALVIGGGAVYAIISKNVPSHIRIIENPGGGPGSNLDMKAYIDQACTQEVGGVEWGDLYQGDQRTMRVFYAKNTGTDAFNLTGSSDLPAAVGELTFQFNGHPTVRLTAGEVAEVMGTLVTQDTSSLGDANFNIIMNLN